MNRISNKVIIMILILGLITLAILLIYENGTRDKMKSASDNGNTLNYETNVDEGNLILDVEDKDSNSESNSVSSLETDEKVSIGEEQEPSKDGQDTESGVDISKDIFEGNDLSLNDTYDSSTGGISIYFEWLHVADFDCIFGEVILPDSVSKSDDEIYRTREYKETTVQLFTIGNKSKDELYKVLRLNTSRKGISFFGDIAVGDNVARLLDILPDEGNSVEEDRDLGTIKSLYGIYRLFVQPSATVVYDTTDKIVSVIIRHEGLELEYTIDDSIIINERLIIVP